MQPSHEAQTPPHVTWARREARSWRASVLRAANDYERLASNHSARNLGRDMIPVLEPYVASDMCARLDGRTFGRGDADILWSSEVAADVMNFIRATDKSTFASQHEERWPGIGALYCECFEKAVNNLDMHAVIATSIGRDDKARFPIGAGRGEDMVR